MTILNRSLLGRFDDGARHVIVRAGLLAREAGRTHLDDETLLVALASSTRLGEPARLGVSAAAVRAVCPGAAEARDRELLATLGIDLDAVRAALPARIDDPARWRLRRPLPLRLRLDGPGTALILTAPARKAVEVALNLRGHGTPATEDALLRGVLADRRTPSFRALTRLPIDLPRLARAVF